MSKETRDNFKNGLMFILILITSVLLGGFIIIEYFLQEEQGEPEKFYDLGTPSINFSNNLSHLKNKIVVTSESQIKLLEFYSEEEDNISRVIPRNLFLNLDIYEQIPCPQPYREITTLAYCFREKEATK